MSWQRCQPNRGALWLLLALALPFTSLGGRVDDSTVRGELHEERRGMGQMTGGGRNGQPGEARRPELRVVGGYNEDNFK